MEYSMYIAKTMTVALTKIGPAIAFLVGGYFIFIKLPFLLFRNSLRNGREYEVAPVRVREEYKEDYDVSDYNNFLRRQSRLNTPKEEPKPDAKQEAKQEKKDEPKREKKQEKKDERRKQERKAPPKQENVSGISPEEALFRFEAGQRFTKDELKKRYRDLLKQSHPDKVSSLGDDFKKLAEVKTKEINSAYDKLKTKAA